MNAIPASLRRFVIRRAGNRCEYCGLAQEGQAAVFHIDHIQPSASGGETTEENLALACVSCSLRKAARETAIDPLTNQVAPLYHPRQDKWGDHFEWRGVLALGITAVGRATIQALQMNRPIILAIRKEEAYFNRHPPPDDR